MWAGARVVAVDPGHDGHAGTRWSLSPVLASSWPVLRPNGGPPEETGAGAARSLAARPW